MQRTVDLDEPQARALERLAARERRSVEDLVRLAVDRYLAEQSSDPQARRVLLDSVVRQFRSGVPADVSPEEIEADILAARNEDRRARGLPDR